MDMNVKCVNCDERYGRHHAKNNACPLHPAGDTRELWDKLSRFEPQVNHALSGPAPNTTVGLPTDAATRKNIPVYTGFVKYFPRGMAAVAELSRIANEQHNPGQPIHWDKSKSTDEKDALMRHMLDEALGVPVDTDDQLHATKIAWRAMANLERILEKQHADRAPLSVSGT